MFWHIIISGAKATLYLSLNCERQDLEAAGAASEEGGGMRKMVDPPASALLL